MIIVSFIFSFQGYAQFDHQYEVMFLSLTDMEIDAVISYVWQMGIMMHKYHY